MRCSYKEYRPLQILFMGETNPREHNLMLIMTSSRHTLKKMKLRSYKTMSKMAKKTAHILLVLLRRSPQREHCGQLVHNEAITLRLMSNTVTLTTLGARSFRENRPTKFPEHHSNHSSLVKTSAINLTLQRDTRVTTLCL